VKVRPGYVSVVLASRFLRAVLGTEQYFPASEVAMSITDEPLAGLTPSDLGGADTDRRGGAPGRSSHTRRPRGARRCPRRGRSAADLVIDS
jgi:hypothetical protein